MCVCALSLEKRIINENGNAMHTTYICIQLLYMLVLHIKERMRQMIFRYMHLQAEAHIMDEILFYIKPKIL